MAQRLRISLKKSPAITIRRVALDHEKLVYVLCADRKLKYPSGYSQIAYIGTTKKGINRIIQSSAYRSKDVLWKHGVQSFDVRIVTCMARQGFKSWVKLERALIITFREMFGEIPLCNVQGKNTKLADEYERFAEDRLKRIIETLSEAGARSEREPIVDAIDYDGDSTEADGDWKD